MINYKSDNDLLFLPHARIEQRSARHRRDERKCNMNGISRLTKTRIHRPWVRVPLWVYIWRGGRPPAASNDAETLHSLLDKLSLAE